MQGRERSVCGSQVRSLVVCVKQHSPLAQCAFCLFSSVARRAPSGHIHADRLSICAPNLRQTLECTSGEPFHLEHLCSTCSIRSDISNCANYTKGEVIYCFALRHLNTEHVPVHSNKFQFLISTLPIRHFGANLQMHFMLVICTVNVHLCFVVLLHTVARTPHWHLLNGNSVLIGQTTS